MDIHFDFDCSKQPWLIFYPPPPLAIPTLRKLGSPWMHFILSENISSNRPYLYLLRYSQLQRHRQLMVAQIGISTRSTLSNFCVTTPTK